VAFVFFSRRANAQPFRGGEQRRWPTLFKKQQFFRCPPRNTSTTNVRPALAQSAAVCVRPGRQEAAPATRKSRMEQVAFFGGMPRIEPCSGRPYMGYVPAPTGRPYGSPTIARCPANAPRPQSPWRSGRPPSFMLVYDVDLAWPLPSTGPAGRHPTESSPIGGRPDRLALNGPSGAKSPAGAPPAWRSAGRSTNFPQPYVTTQKVRSTPALGRPLASWAATTARFPRRSEFAAGVGREEPR